jgi:hypothetical protein
MMYDEMEVQAEMKIEFLARLAVKKAGKASSMLYNLWYRK